MKLRPRMAILASGFGSSMQPKVLLSDQSEREHPLDLAWLEQLGQSALARVVAVQRNRGVLRALEEIEILDEAGCDLNQELILSGELTPVFFGSAMTNFGVRPFLDNF